MLVCLLDLDCVKIWSRSGPVAGLGYGWSRLTAGESILVRCAGMVCNLYPTSLVHGVVVEIDIAALVKAVVRGLVGGRREVVVYVCKAVQDQLGRAAGAEAGCSQGQERHFSLQRRHRFGTLLVRAGRPVVTRRAKDAGKLYTKRSSERNGEKYIHGFTKRMQTEGEPAPGLDAILIGPYAPSLRGVGANHACPEGSSLSHGRVRHGPSAAKGKHPVQGWRTSEAWNFGSAASTTRPTTGTRSSTTRKKKASHRTRPPPASCPPVAALHPPSTALQRPPCGRKFSLAATAICAPRPPVAMSLVNLAHVCSHLQNASKARLGLTSIPVSKMHVNLMLGLQREGFISSVTLGGTTPPQPFLLQDTIEPEDHEEMARRLANQPWAAYPVHETPKTPSGTLLGGKEILHDVKVPQNPARRRLWLGLKYWNNEPVLKHMKLVSKPTRRIWLTSEDLGKITRTRESAYVKGLTHTGECMFLTTDRGILEARECVERKLGGMALCRVF